MNTDARFEIRLRLLVRAAEEEGRRLVARMLDSGDRNAVTVKMLLDALTFARESGAWWEAERAATGIIEWIAEVEG